MREIAHHFINGQLVQSHGQEVIEIRNPATGVLLGQAVLGDEVDAQRAIHAAEAAFPAWAATSLAERREWLQRLGAAVADRSDDLKAAMIAEFGALASFAEAGAAISVGFFQQAAHLLVPSNFEERVGTAIVDRVPLGVAGLLTPWNGNPMFICGKAAFALAAGCTVVIKPSEMSVLQTQVLLEAFESVGLPPGVVNVVNGRGDPVGNTIVKSPIVRKISFTGSTDVGKMIHREASETMKRVTLELGGKSPSIILDDADMSKAVTFALQAGLYNTGQGCIAGARIFVPEARMAEAEAAFKQAAEALTIGDPGDGKTIIQPMVSQSHWVRVQGYIEKGIAEGAQLLAGGLGKPQGFEAGNYVKPTVFTNVQNDMVIAQEEIFGPVLSLISYKNDDDVVAMANDSQYGLFGYLFGEDMARMRSIASRLQVGTVVINEMQLDLNVPFGGFKVSGIGRENGIGGLLSYTETRAIYEPRISVSA